MYCDGYRNVSDHPSSWERIAYLLCSRPTAYQSLGQQGLHEEDAAPQFEFDVSWKLFLQIKHKPKQIPNMYCFTNLRRRGEHYMFSSLEISVCGCIDLQEAIVMQNQDEDASRRSEHP